MLDPQITIEETDDPAVAERLRQQHERHRSNANWLESHWIQLLPQAYGKHVAVAGQEAFIADTAADASARAAAAHPDDDGVLVQYVIAPGGQRLYGNQGILHLGIGWSDATDSGSVCTQGERKASGSAVSG